MTGAAEFGEAVSRSLGVPVVVERFDDRWAVAVAPDGRALVWTRYMADAAVAAALAPGVAFAPAYVLGDPPPAPTAEEPPSPTAEEPARRLSRRPYRPRPVRRDAAWVALREREAELRAELAEQRARRAPPDLWIEGIGWLTPREAAAFFHDDVELDDLDAEGRLREAEPEHDWDIRTEGNLRPESVAVAGWGGIHSGWGVSGRVRRPRLPIDDCRSATE